jgi:hypothetical protein
MKTNAIRKLRAKPGATARFLECPVLVGFTREAKSTALEDFRGRAVAPGEGGFFMRCR